MSMKRFVSFIHIASVVLSIVVHIITILDNDIKTIA